MPHEFPSFTVIVPTFERPTPLSGCLEALAGLDYPPERLEVIVVDDGSAETPESVLAPFRDRLDLTLLVQPHAGQSTARNAAAARAQGTFLAFTDDDCRPAASWLRALAARFAAHPDRAVGGRTINAFPANPYCVTSQAILDIVYGYYNADPERAQFFASNNLAVPADPLREIGGFHSAFSTSEDREFCARWLDGGRAMTYAPEAVVTHAPSLSFTGFCRQHFTYGRGARRFHARRSLAGNVRFKPEMNFYARLVDVQRCPLWHLREPLGARRAALAAVWQTVNAVGYLWEKLHPGVWPTALRDAPAPIARLVPVETPDPDAEGEAW